MDFIRWYSKPVIAGFALGLMVNPLLAVIGFLLWLAIIYYVFRRWSTNPEH